MDANFLRLIGDWSGVKIERMSENNLCGRPISGDPNRPCALKAGHPTGRKGRAHRDAAALDDNRAWGPRGGLSGDLASIFRAAGVLA